MFTIPEQFSAASKATLESQLALLNALTNKTFEGVEKVLDLHLSAAKESLEESNATTKQFLSAKDAQEWLSLVAAQTQPNAEKALAYSRGLASIASGLQAEFSKVAEAQIAETSRKVLELVEEVTKNAPAGTENAIAMVKSTIGNVNAGYEQLSKTTKQAVEALEANLNTVTQLQPVTKAARAAGKK
ncbi:MAG: TIGR01841 family phasin [Bacillota bacterium]